MINDPKGRYIGIVQHPALGVPDGDGWWVLTNDGSVYFGHLLDPPETGFGILSKQTAAPAILLQELAAIADGVTGDEGEWDDEEMEMLPRILQAGLGGTMEEAEEIAEILLEASDREGECPWKLAALYMSGYSDDAELSAKTEKPAEPRRDAKVIPFPAHMIRPPSGSV